jgi:hypothetical protein
LNPILVRDLIVLAVVLAISGGAVIVLVTAAEDSRGRGLLTYGSHIVILLFGWFSWKWRGIFFISFPLLGFYYLFLFLVSLIIIPASDPESWAQRFLRIRYFIFYTWGFQYPAWAVPSSTAREIETRIRGNQFRKWFGPGLVWAYSHQVVGLSSGITFSRAESPGILFTRQFERPIDGVIDLRTQLRTFNIDVVSSDGIPYKAVLFTSFKVDGEAYNRNTFNLLRHNERLLKEARNPDFTKGSFPISSLRIRTLLSASGDGSATPDLPRKAPIYWDQMVMYLIEKAACEVLSQMRFDELWLPRNDVPGACAGDDIAAAIRERIGFELLCRGVRYFSCRLVNFKFEREKQPHPGPVEAEQIAVWQADWQRDASQARADGKAEAELVEQDARAFAYASLLNAIAKGLRVTGAYPKSIPPKLIAMRFIGALEEMLQDQPDEDGKGEALSALKDWKKYI